LFAVVLGGCVPQAKGRELERQTKEHERRIADLEEGIREERKQLRAEVDRAQQKVTELEQVLEEATQVVTRNSADLGAEVEQLQGRLAELEGKLAELRHELEQTREKLEEQRSELTAKMETFARRAGVDLALPAEEIPDDKDAHWKALKEALERDEHSKARALAREYLRRYPDDEKADNAQYELGASYLAQDKPATALGELQKVIQEHQGKDAADDALFAMADAFFRLGSCGDAKAALKALTRNYRRSPLLREARSKLREIERAPGSRCRN
jgi:TolA-binding protein